MQKPVVFWFFIPILTCPSSCQHPRVSACPLFGSQGFTPLPFCSADRVREHHLAWGCCGGCEWLGGGCGGDGCCCAGTSAGAGEGSSGTLQAPHRQLLAVGAEQHPVSAVAGASSCVAGCSQPAFGVYSQRRGREGLPAQLRLHGGSCTYPTLSRSVVGASSPGRAAGALGGLASLCLSLPCPSPRVPTPWHETELVPGDGGGSCTVSPAPRGARGGWMRSERCLRCLCLPRPTWVPLCKSIPVGDWISAIVCARQSVADKMKLCLQTPIGTNSMLKWV